jgi:hypothetical protein
MQAIGAPTACTCGHPTIHAQHVVEQPVRVLTTASLANPASLSRAQPVCAFADKKGSEGEQTRLSHTVQFHHGSKPLLWQFCNLPLQRPQFSVERSTFGHLFRPRQVWHHTRDALFQDQQLGM